MGAAFPLADLSISGPLREEFRLVLNLTETAFHGTWSGETGRMSV